MKILLSFIYGGTKICIVNSWDELIAIVKDDKVNSWRHISGSL